MDDTPFVNPFRPGAGHMPPYLAGREKETAEFARLLGQQVILENLVLTGLRGVGKTVLHEKFKPLAIEKGWRWVGNDLSEASSVSEERLAVRLLADLAVVTSSFVLGEHETVGIGYQTKKEVVSYRLDFDTMLGVFSQTPGLISDKLKAVLELVWACMRRRQQAGLIFAYDEAQNLADQSAKDEYPLSLLLDVFQSLQKKEVPFMLVLVGLPTLFPKLVEARTFSERMFRVVFLDRLSPEDSRMAICVPMQHDRCPISLTESSIDTICSFSGGYPYFIQFICREVFDVFFQATGVSRSGELEIPFAEVIDKLDNDFFTGRWTRTTDRQRELLSVIANLHGSDSEFTVQEVVAKSKELLQKPFSPSQVSQMLAALSNKGLVYKNRHGRYSFAVPLLGEFILRQRDDV